MLINNVDRKVEFREKKLFKSTKRQTLLSISPFKNNKVSIKSPVRDIKSFPNASMTNNIIHEINRIKLRNSENSINYLNLYNLTANEYEESLQKIKNISEELTEDHIYSIIAIKKLNFTYKHIAELFSYLLDAVLVFDWKRFRNNLNIYETKFKMCNVQFDKINYKILCNILNKITKDKHFTGEYLQDKEIGMYLIFQWIREVLKVFFYLEKQKKKSLSESEAKRFKSSKEEYRQKIKDKKKPKVINLELNFEVSQNRKENCLDREDKNLDFPGVEPAMKEREDLRIGHKTFYLTNCNEIQNPRNSPINKNYPNTLKILKDQKPKILSSSLSKEENLVKQKEILFDLNLTENKLNKDRNGLLFLPLISYKNFHELKKFYQLHTYINTEDINNKHSTELNKVSMRKPINTNKIVTLISSNRLHSIGDNSIQNFVLFNDSEYNEDKMKLEIKKRNKLCNDDVL